MNGQTFQKKANAVCRKMNGQLSFRKTAKCSLEIEKSNGQTFRKTDKCSLEKKRIHGQTFRKTDTCSFRPKKNKQSDKHLKKEANAV